MWWCNLCSLKTSRRGNVIRHIREVHGIDDPNAQNATKDSNTGVKSNGKDTTTRVSNRQQPRIMSAGIPLSGTYDKSTRWRTLTWTPPRMEEEYSEEDEPRTSPVKGLYPPEQIEEIGNDMRRKKCHILDCVLDTFPEHLKTKAKSMCDTLKSKNRISILPSHEIVIDGGGRPRKQPTRLHRGFIN